MGQMGKMGQKKRSLECLSVGHALCESHRRTRASERVANMQKIQVACMDPMRGCMRSNFLADLAGTRENCRTIRTPHLHRQVQHRLD